MTIEIEKKENKVSIYINISEILEYIDAPYMTEEEVKSIINEKENENDGGDCDE